MDPYEPKYDTRDCLDRVTLDTCVVRCAQGWSPANMALGFDEMLSTSHVEARDANGATLKGGWPFECRPNATYSVVLDGPMPTCTPNKCLVENFPMWGTACRGAWTPTPRATPCLASDE
jgi:hypothetical protein